MKSINNSKRDNLGTIELEQLKLRKIKDIRPGKYDNFSFYYNNEEYFFKRCSSINSIYNELLAEELAKDYGIECAHYDLASYDGMIGTISKNILEKGDLFHQLSEFVTDDSNDTQTILQQLKQIYKDENTINILKKELIDIIIFDILIANHDRHSDNLGIIENKSGIHFGPIYDNELMLDYRSIYNGEYSLKVYEDDLEENLIKELKQKLGIIAFKNIASCIKRVENKIGTPINPYIKNVIYESFNSNYKMINKSINKDKKYIKRKN